MQLVNSTKEAIDYINDQIDFIKANYDPKDDLFAGMARNIFAAIRVNENGLPHDYTVCVDYRVEDDAISVEKGKWVGRDQLANLVTKALAKSGRDINA